MQKLLDFVDWSSLRESKGTGLTQEQEEFLNKCTEGSWNYNAATGLVDVEGDFDCSLCGIPNFKDVKFGKVSGEFDCSSNKLTSLEGAPQEVGGGFDCNYTYLTSLKGAPQKVGGNFFCSYNKLTSLEGAPQEVGGDFVCLENKLTSLEGAPQEVGGNFDCSRNNLTSLEGAPQEVGGGFYCGFFKLGPGKWNLGGWLRILKSRKPEAQSLILTLISPDVLNRKIQKDPAGMIRKFKNVWNSPDFEKIKKGLKFPDDFGDVDRMIKSLNRMDDIKDFI